MLYSSPLKTRLQDYFVNTRTNKHAHSRARVRVFVCVFVCVFVYECVSIYSLKANFNESQRNTHYTGKHQLANIRCCHMVHVFIPNTQTII